MSAIFERVWGSTPDRQLIALMAIQLVVWSLAPLLVHTALPLDVAEMYVWGREWVVATYKHPNLPGYILEATRLLTFGGYWPSYLVSQLCVIAAFGAVYLLGKDILGAPRALAGTLMMTGIYYYSWSTPEMNHNVMQIPLWAGVWLTLWRAVEGRGLAWWIALGALAGLSIWAKYSSIFLLVVVLGWCAYDAKTRRTFLTPGPYLAALVGLVIVAPQIHYVLSSNFLPLDYLADRASRDINPWYNFLGAQILNHIVLVIALAATGFLGRGMRTALPADAPAAAPSPGPDARSRMYLTVMGLGPLTLCLLMSAFAGMNFKSMWGTPLFSLSGLVFLAWFGGRFSEPRLRKLMVAASILLALVPTAYLANHLVTAQIAPKPMRTQWPQREIATFMENAFQEETAGAPLRYTAGYIWDAGIVALSARGNVSVYTDADPQRASWIDPADVEEAGLLAVWEARRTPSETLKALIGDRPVQQAVFAWSPNPDTAPITMNYVVIPPASSEPAE